jgi:hypothetical protein
MIDAKGIRRLQRESNISVSEFSQFGLIGRITTAEEEEQNLSDLLGFDDEEFAQFVSGIYDSCKKTELQLYKVAYLVLQDTPLDGPSCSS